MKKVLINGRNMGLSVQSQLIQYSDVFVGDVLMLAKQLELKNNLSTMEVIMQKQKGKTKPQREIKEDYRKEMADLIIETKSRPMIWAEENSKTELLAALNYPYTAFVSGASANSVSAARIVWKALDDNLSDLIAVGLTQPKVDAIDAAIIKYTGAEGGTGSKKSTISANTTLLDEKVKEMKKIVKKVGKCWEDYKKSNPEAYLAFQSAKVIVDLGGSTTFIKGMINNGTLPYKGVKVELIGANGTVFKITKLNGMYYFAVDDAGGVFNLKLSIAGQPDKLIENIVLNHKDHKTLNIDFTPVSNPAAAIIGYAIIAAGQILTVGKFSDFNLLPTSKLTFKELLDLGAILKFYFSDTEGAEPGADFIIVNAALDVDVLFSAMMSSLKTYLLVKNDSTFNGKYNVSFV